MFLKQYNYKPRSGSQGAADNTAAVDNTANAAAESAANSTAAAQGRRRSSATEKFAGLQAYKRGSQDQGANKQSFADQKPGGAGVLGSMWSNFTKGTN